MTRRDPAKLTPEQCKLVEDNIRLVRWCIGRYFRHLNPEMMDDLDAEGNLGLVQAAQRWDPSRNVKFSGYAVIRIRGQIKDYLRRQLGDSRRNYDNRPRTLSLDRLMHNSSGDRNWEGPGEDESGYERIELGDTANITLRELLRPLSSRDRQIVLLYASGLTHDEVAKRMGISRSRSVQIVHGSARIKSVVPPVPRPSVVPTRTPT